MFKSKCFLGASLSLFLLGTAALHAETVHRSFELSGKRSTVGDWNVIEQGEGTMVLLAGGKTSSKRHGDMLSLSASPASLQVTCSERVVSAAFVIPTTDALPFKDHIGKPLYATLSIDQEKPKLGRIEVTKEDLSGDALAIGLFKSDLAAPIVQQFKNAKEISVRVSSPDLDSVTVSYQIEKTKEAFGLLEAKCGR